MRLLYMLRGVLAALSLDGEFDPKTPDKGVLDEVTGKFNLMLGIGLWAVTGLCVAGVLIVAGKLAVAHRRGEAGEHVGGLAGVGLACLLAGGASQLVYIFL